MTTSETKTKKQALDFKTMATVLMALTSLWIATIVWLQSGISLQVNLAAQRSRAEAVAAFGELTRADQRVTHGLDIYSAWFEASQQALRASNSAQAARLQGDEAGAQAQDATAARWQQLQSELSALTPLLSEEFDGQYINFYEEFHRESYLTYQRQLEYEREAVAWKARSGNFRTALTMLTVTLFLLGLSLNIQNWVRYIFTGTALILEITTIFLVLQSINSPVHVTSEAALEHFVDGQILSNIAYVAPQNEAEEIVAAALSAFDAALALDDQYAAAYQWRGTTLMQTRLRDADPARNAQAAQDMQMAIELGNDSSVVYTNLGWANTLAGAYDAAMEALNLALDAEPTECTARINLGLALLADHQADAASQAYDQAIDCLLEESPDEQANLLASALIDLGDLQLQAGENPDINATVQRFKETSASLSLLGETTASTTSAQVAKIIFAGNIAADGGLVDESFSFPAGTPSIYTIIDFTEMEANIPWMVRWYFDGEFELYDQYLSEAWTGDSAGTASIRLRGTPLASGEYQTEVYVAGNLLASESFEVQTGESVAMQAYTSSHFQISINHPSAWSVTEDSSESGYIYLADPNSDANYLWYTSFPWDGPDSESVLSNLMVLWFSQHPDLSYGQQGELFLGGLAQANFMPITYKDTADNLLAALLIGMVDDSGTAYVLVMQASADQFVDINKTIFDPMLRSFEIVQMK